MSRRDREWDKMQRLYAVIIGWTVLGGLTADEARRMAWREKRMRLSARQTRRLIDRMVAERFQITQSEDGRYVCTIQPTANTLRLAAWR